jgi:hypothetical protein
MRAVLLGLLLLAAGAAQAATIAVGPERPVKLPSQGVAQAAEGDVVMIDEGEYFDCLRLRVDGVTVEGTGKGAVLTDATCDGKAIVVSDADRIVLRNLTLQRARVPDGNGAGIRAEGGDLTVEKVVFANDQSGIIIADAPKANVVIRDSQFSDTGRCQGARCANAVSAGRIRSLRIEHSRLGGTVASHQIVTAARRTDLVGDLIGDGASGGASYQVMATDGGSLVMEDCVVQKGPRAANARAAVLLDGPAGEAVAFRRNHFVDDTGQNVPFVLNWSGSSPVFEDNVIPPGDSELSTNGALAHRLIETARDLKQDARHTVGTALRTLRGLVP